MSDKQAYPKTRSGVIEVKHLTKALVMSSQETEKNYFDRARDATPFMKLFRYIQTHQLPMTIPVEVDIENNVMLFYAPLDSEENALPSTDQVIIQTLPERTVASIGMRGPYSLKNFEKGKAKLQDWLKAHPEWKITGKPYAVYWNSPFTLPFLKHAEIHIAISANQ